MEIQVASLFHSEQLLEVSLAVYDLDGMKGLYVPDSDFRELVEDMGDQVASGQQLRIDPAPDNRTKLMMDLARDAFSATTRAASKSIRKQQVKLNYNSQVYLVNQD